MVENNKTKSRSEAFFEVLSHRDVRLLQKKSFIVHIFFDIVLVLIIFMLILMNAYSSIRPVPVVLTNAQTGHVTYVEDTKAPLEVSEITVKEFMRTYIQKRSAQDPDIAANHSFVYTNMQTPRFSKILDADREDAGKHQKYFDKNIKADFYIENIKISGEKKAGGKLTVIGTGYMYFRPAVGFDGDYNNFQKIPCFYQAGIEVHEQRVKIPWGILIDYYKIDYFQDDDLLKAFLMKARIEFSENAVEEAGNVEKTTEK